MARRKLTTFSKFLLTMLVVGGLAYGFIYLRDNGYLADMGIEPAEGTDKPKKKKRGGSSDDDDVINIGVVTWGGYAGGQYFNEGFEANEKSRFYKDYGFKVNFKVLDVFIPSRKAFENDEVDLLWATVDALPTEMGILRGEPQIVFQADWSRGGDAVVVRRGINSVADLKGKKIAVAKMTPSHTFLLWLLKAGDLKVSDVDLDFYDDAIAAAEAFKSKSVDAAVVWSPDDEICIEKVKGSKILENTKNASNIIADVFIAKKSFIEDNEERLAQLYEGWMKGAAEINASDENKRKAANILADGLGQPEDFTYSAINNVRLCTHGDNLNFFGINRDYQGVTGEDLYSKMTKEYDELGFIDKTPPSWRIAAYKDMVNDASLEGKVGQEAEAGKKFVKVTNDAEGKKKRTIASKKLSISFASGSSTLDDNAKYIIDELFVDIAKAFSNSQIRIEGNTDAVGSKSSNIVLSKKRAQAVANYLTEEYDMPAERFIIIGNGPDKPVEGCENSRSEECNRKNRRTDFEIVADN